MFQKQFLVIMKYFYILQIFKTLLSIWKLLPKNGWLFKHILYVIQNILLYYFVTCCLNIYNIVIITHMNHKYLLNSNVGKVYENAYIWNLTFVFYTPLMPKYYYLTTQQNKPSCFWIVVTIKCYFALCFILLNFSSAQYYVYFSILDMAMLMISYFFLCDGIFGKIWYLLYFSC